MGATKAVSDYYSGLSSSDAEICQQVFSATYGLDLILDSNTLGNYNYYYSLNFISESRYNRIIAGIEACLDKLEPTELAAYKTALTAGKTTIQNAQYTDKIDIDWTNLTSSVNVNPTMTLTDEQKASLVATTLASSLSTSLQNALIDDIETSLTNINALDDSWNFVSITEFDEYVTEQARLFVLQETNDFVSKLSSRGSALAEAFGLTDSRFGRSRRSTGLKTEYEIYWRSYVEDLTTVRTDSNSDEDNYNSGFRFGFSALMIYLVMLIKV